MDRKIIKLSKGITLIELLVVISIMAILISIGIYNYNTWISKNKLEKDVRTIYSLLNAYRQKSYTEKTSFIMIFDNNSSIGNLLYIIKEDDNSTSETINLSNTFKFKSSTQKYIKISKQGFFDGSSLYCDTISDAPFSCISVDNIRIKMGNWNGNDCIVK